MKISKEPPLKFSEFQLDWIKLKHTKGEEWNFFGRMDLPPSFEYVWSTVRDTLFNPRKEWFVFDEMLFTPMVMGVLKDDLEDAPDLDFIIGCPISDEIEGYFVFVKKSEAEIWSDLVGWEFAEGG